jgi:hypothetical protein
MKTKIETRCARPLDSIGELSCKIIGIIGGDRLIRSKGPCGITFIDSPLITHKVLVEIAEPNPTDERHRCTTPGRTIRITCVTGLIDRNHTVKQDACTRFCRSTRCAWGSSRTEDGKRCHRTLLQCFITRQEPEVSPRQQGHDLWELATKARQRVGGVLVHNVKVERERPDRDTKAHSSRVTNIEPRKLFSELRSWAKRQ